MSSYGLHAGSQTPEFVRVLDQIHQDNLMQAHKIRELEQKIVDMQKPGGVEGKKEWTDLKPFAALESYDGDEKEFGGLVPNNGVDLGKGASPP